MFISIDPIKYPFCYDGLQYANDVKNGKIDVCIFIRGAVDRFFKDLAEKKYIFDLDAAEKYLRQVQKFHHVKGEWATPHIKYEPWQNFAFMNIMGWINPATGKRRFRTAHLEVPRGHGKSLMASQAALYFLALDNPKGNEIACAATKKESARIVLDSAMAMARSNERYLRLTGVVVRAHKIEHKASNSFVRALSSDKKSQDGLNDVLTIMDELHAITQEFFDVIVSGMKKRNDSLLLCITTAGFDTAGVGYSQSNYAKKIALGEIEDDTFFSLVYTIDEGDDVLDERTWRKANPNYGVSVDPIAFKADMAKAEHVPTALNNIKVKNLNIWTSESRAYFSISKWDKCYDPNLTFDDIRGKVVIGALDLSSKVDLAAKAYIGIDKEGKYCIFTQAFIPEESIKESPNKTIYQNNIGKELFPTFGEAIDYEEIKETIKKDNQKLKIESMMFDPWNATQISQDLMKERMNMVEFRMNTGNFSEPMKLLDAYIREGKVRHNCGELTRFCISNVVSKEDANGNVYPRKTHDDKKIDIAVAVIMAFAGWVVKESTPSVYESRGVRTL